MPRIPYAAQRLIDDAKAHKPKAKVDAARAGDPDGFGVFRTIAFNKATSKWLAPLLEVLNDPRIVQSVVNDDGLLEVTFSPRINADDRSPFPLREAETVVGGD